MKTLIFILLGFGSLSAQSLYNPRANTKVSSIDTERFVINVEKNAYGIVFPRGQRALDNSLQSKIEKFLKTTLREKYQPLGTYSLEIIKRRGAYFVVESHQPERLNPL